MTEYSRMAKGNFTVSGPAATPLSAVVNLPFQPDYVELWNYSNIKTAATHSVTRAWWDNQLFDGNNNPTMIELYAGSNSSSVFDTIQTNGISTFAAGQLLQYGPAYGHTGSTDFSITKASPAAITTTTAHGLNSGDVVIFEGLFETSTTGMPQINGIPFTVTVTSSTGFTIPWDTSGSNYTVFNTATSTGNVGIFKKVLYPYLYFPGQSFISAITLGATTTVSTTDAHNFVVGQEVAFRIPNAWGPVQLNSLPNTLVPGSPVYGFVISVTDYHTVVVNINSSAFTAFTVNQTVASLPGLSYPQIVAVGDVNTGGVVISAGSPLYPSPNYTPIGTTNVPTINGPAIRGAYVNNTSQGFVIGAGTAAVDTTSSIMTNGNIIYWHAYLHDFGKP
jgi:hypothetical protein